MTDFRNLFPDNLYHSYIIQGNPQIIVDDLKEYLIEKKIIERSSPDIFLNIYTALTIDDSKIIKNWIINKELIGNKKICIIGVEFINHESERSLLKILEEPRQNNHFFIICPNIGFISDTILSRVHSIILEDEEISLTNEKINEVDEFINSKIFHRLEIIDRLIKQKKLNDPGLLRAYSLKFINEIEKKIYKKNKTIMNSDYGRMIFHEFQNARLYLSNSGSSAKMILEELALIIDENK